jgi:inhibitor of apoptosis domain-containing protein
MCVRLVSYLATRINRLLRMVLLPFMDPPRPTPRPAQSTSLGKGKPLVTMWYNLDSNRLMTFSNLPELEHLAAEGYYAISPREVVCIGCNEKCRVIRTCHMTVVDHRRNYYYRCPIISVETDMGRVSVGLDLLNANFPLKQIVKLEYQRICTAERLETFTNNQHFKSHIPALEFAEHGFVCLASIDEPDAVMCRVCGVGIVNWKEGDDITTEHKKMQPLCERALHGPIKMIEIDECD